MLFLLVSIKDLRVIFYINQNGFKLKAEMKCILKILLPNI